MAEDRTVSHPPFTKNGSTNQPLISFPDPRSAGRALNDKTRYIRERLPDKKHSIDLLAAEDPEFLSLCEDYDDCVNALRYWARSEKPEADTRVKEYHTLIRELQEEIAQALAALESRRLD